MNLQYKVNHETGCWEWMLSRFRTGYGSVSQNGKTRRAHIVYYEKFIGPVPKGLELDHICKNKACVNPQHLVAVTHAENCRRAIAKLSKEQVKEIKNSDFTKVSKASLGRKFGVSRYTISKVVFGVNWRSL